MLLPTPVVDQIASMPPRTFEPLSPRNRSQSVRRVPDLHKSQVRGVLEAEIGAQCFAEGAGAPHLHHISLSFFGRAAVDPHILHVRVSEVGSA